MRFAVEEGKCVVVATHDVKWIDENCFDMIVLSGGRNLANGTLPFYRAKADYLTLRPPFRSYSVPIRSDEEKEAVLDYLRGWPHDVHVDPFCFHNEVKFRAVPSSIPTLLDVLNRQFTLRSK